MAHAGEKLLWVKGAVCDAADGDEELEMMVCQDDPECTVVMVKGDGDWAEVHLGKVALAALAGEARRRLTYPRIA